MTANLPKNLNKFSVTHEIFYPEKIGIESTRACNLKCPNCKRTVEGFDSKDSIPRAVMSEIARLIPHLEIATISGWGESLMGASTWDVFDLTKEFEVSSSVTTNGTLLSEARCRQLVEKRVGSVCVSMDAGTSEGYARLRPGGVPLEKVIEGIRRLARTKEEMGSELPQLVAAFNFYEDSKDEIVPLISLMGELPIKSLIVQTLFLTNFPENNDDYKLSEKAVENYRAACELANVLGIEVLPAQPEILEFHLDARKPSFDSLSYFPNRDEIGMHKLVPTCLAPWMNPFIDLKGNLYPCCIYPESFGNIAESSFEDVWMNEKFTQFRADLVNGKPAENCMRCRQTAWYSNPVYQNPSSVVRMDEDGWVGLGWNDLEHAEAETPFRWSRDVCSVHLLNTGEPFLFIEGTSRMYGHEVEIMINDRPAGILTFPTYWAVVALPVGEQTEKVLHISMKCRMPMRDPAFESAWERRRILGIAAAQIGLCKNPKNVRSLNPQSINLTDEVNQAYISPIQILSPNSNADWQTGSRQEVHWKTNASVLGTAVLLQLINGDNVATDLGTFNHPGAEAKSRIKVPEMGEGAYTLRATAAWTEAHPEIFCKPVFVDAAASIRVAPSTFGNKIKSLLAEMKYKARAKAGHAWRTLVPRTQGKPEAHPILPTD